MEKTFSSFTELRSEYRLANVLERLEERVCQKLGIESPLQHCLNKLEEDENVGILEVTRKLNYFDSISEIVNDFYKEEGFDVKQTSKESFTLTKENKEYWALIAQTDKAYTIYVIDSQIK